MKKIIQLVFFLSLSFKIHAQPQPQQVSFSIQAHPDDWQLFMSAKLVADLVSGGKVVFITVTAGDGGNGTGQYGSTIPYYVAREKGANYSSKVASDLTGGTIAADPVAQTVTINGHSITKYVYRNNIVNYFLRLPDGDYTGAGYAYTHNISLRRLQIGLIPSATSIAAPFTTYTGWADLTNTIRTIITTERGNDNQVWINTPSLDATYNSEDHSDHLFSSMAAQDAVSDSLWVGIAEFKDYSSGGFPANLSNSDHQNAAAIYAACAWGLTENTYYGNFEPGHKAWLSMDYFFIKRTPVGNAPLINPDKTDLSKTNSIIAEKPGNETILTEIPMIVSITSPVSTNTEIKMYLSQHETGQVSTSIYDLSGKILAEKITNVESKGLVTVTINNPVKTPGVYWVKNILNNKYIETRKITVQ